MSTFKEIIARVDESKPNDFPAKRKLQWLTVLDGRIAADVFLMGIEEIRELPHDFPEAMNAEPLVGHPHDDLYDYYLEAKIDAAHGEYDRYQNAMELYNESYSNFVKWFCSVYRPAQGGCRMRSDIPTYYLTAYGLAVKHGYRGSVEEWLTSLEGKQGDTGKSAYEYALEAGYTGTEEAFREGQLNNGKTAYEYAVDGGYTGTAQEFAVKMAAEYAPANHNHDTVYSKTGHDHAGVYAAEGHNHDTVYSKTGHDHDTVYSKTGHDHAGVYAAEDHNHDTVYSKTGHNHDTTYLKKSGGTMTGALTMKGIILTRGVDYGTESERPANPVEGQVYWRIE